MGQIWVFTPSTGGDVPEEKLLGVVAPHDLKQTIIDRAEASRTGGTPRAADMDETTGAPSLDIAESVVLLREIRDTLIRIDQNLASPRDNVDL